MIAKRETRAIQAPLLTSVQPSFRNSCLIFAWRCATVAAVAVVISTILFSARSTPKARLRSDVRESVDSPRPSPLTDSRPGNAPDLSEAAGGAQEIAKRDATRDGKSDVMAPSIPARHFSFNGLVRPATGDGGIRVRTPRPRPAAPHESQTKPRGISIDVTSSFISRPIEIGRNGTSVTPR